MRTRFVGLAWVFVGLVTLSSGCRPESAATGDPREVVENVIVNSISWALTKNRALQEETMAKDESLFYFWLDSNSTIHGWSEHEKLFDIFMDPRFKAIKTEVRDLHVTLSRSGDVAWYWCYLDDLGEWDGRPVGAENIRWTGVLENRAGKWVIVQMHASLATDAVREEALETERN
jgi:hypothetical protein